jgi:hypothetical protein
MEPGQYETVSLTFKPVGQVIPAGHRLRLALSTSYWPMAWPSSEPVTLTVDPSGSHLDLPLLADEPGLPSVQWEPAESAPRGPVAELEPGRQERRVEIDAFGERATLSARSEDGRYLIEEISTEVASWRRKVYSIAKGDPLSCETTVTCGKERRRGDWRPEARDRGMGQVGPSRLPCEGLASRPGRRHALRGAELRRGHPSRLPLVPTVAPRRSSPRPQLCETPPAQGDPSFRRSLQML